MALLLFLCFSLPFSALGSSDYLTDVESKILAGDLHGAYELFTSGPFIIKNPQLHSKVSNEVETVLRFCSESAKFNKAIASGNENLALGHFKNVRFLHDKLPATLHFSEKLSQTIEASYKGNSEKYESIVAKLAAARADQERKVATGKEEQINAIKAELAETEKKRAAAAAAAKKKHQDFMKRAEQEEKERDAYIASLQKECGDDYKNIKVGMTLDRANKCYGEFFQRGQVQTKYGIVSRYSRGGVHLFVKNGQILAWESF